MWPQDVEVILNVLSVMEATTLQFAWIEVEIRVEMNVIIVPAMTVIVRMRIQR